MTIAVAFVKSSSHTVPHTPWWRTSTLPCRGLLPFAKRNSNGAWNRSHMKIFKSIFTFLLTYIAMFRIFIGVVWTVDHLVANEGSRYTSWTIVAFPVTFLTSVDRGFAYDSNSLFRLTIMNSPSRNENK